MTRRYVRNATTHGAERNRAPEEVLMWIMNEIRRQRRENIPKEERRRIFSEDAREEKELRGYVVQALAAEIGKMLPSGAETAGNEQKVPSQRSTAASSWQQLRSDSGSAPDVPPRPSREGH